MKSEDITLADADPLDKAFLAEAIDFASASGHPFVDADIETGLDFGLDFGRAARAFIHNKAARKNKFVRKMWGEYKKGEDFNTRQVRVLLNIMREHVLNLEPARDDPLVELAMDPDLAGRFKCGDCHTVFDHMVDFLEHRADAHGYTPGFGTLDAAILDPVSVLSEPAPTKLDISDLHDGFYAKPENNKDGFVIYRVRRLTRKVHLNRRFVYGKRITGSELAPVGTISVRRLRGDTKEMVGYQKPDEGFYRGSAVEDLEFILPIQEVCAQLYALAHERCMICGKRLTDQISRNDKMGPLCVKKYGSGYFKRPPVLIEESDEGEASEEAEADEKVSA